MMRGDRLLLFLDYLEFLGVAQGSSSDQTLNAKWNPRGFSRQKCLDLASRILETSLAASFLLYPEELRLLHSFLQANAEIISNMNFEVLSVIEKFFGSPESMKRRRQLHIYALVASGEITEAMLKETPK